MKRTIKKKKELHILSGFLGVKEDWNQILEGLRPLEMDVIIIHTFQSNLPHLLGDMNHWAQSFVKELKNQTHVVDRYLMGYSMGGRLALHVISQDETLWKGVCVLSTHPGLSNEIDRRNRALEDLEWSQRFKVEPWNLLMEAWESRSVFKGTGKIVRHESNYNRETLAHIMNYWSLAHQIDFIPKVSLLSIPVIWVAGGRDFRYMALGDRVHSAGKYSCFHLIEHAGHRLIQDAPAQVSKLLLGLGFW